MEFKRDAAHAVITDIQKFTVHDGPGIRTMVFFKGCPLRCEWCHNPETLDVKAELIHNQTLCIGCGKCLDACRQGAISAGEDGVRIDRSKCVVCGSCARTCFIGALEIAGYVVTLDELYDKLTEDEVFYKSSGGGVTLSGGECTMQPQFVTKLLQKLKKNGIHTAIETCGCCNTETFLKITDYVDLVLFDVKVPETEKSKKHCGRGNELILKNLSEIAERGREIVIRFPMIPGCNDDEDSIRKIADIACRNGIKRLNIMPFHQLGASKYRFLDKEYNCEEIKPPDNEDIQRALDIFLACGLDASVGGSKA